MTEDEVVGWHHQLNDHEFNRFSAFRLRSSAMNMSLSKLWEIVKDRETWRAAAHGVTESDTTERLNNNIYLSTHISICHLSVCTHRKPDHSSSVLILGTVLRKNSHPMLGLEGISEVCLRTLRQITQQVCGEAKLELVSSTPSPALSSTLSLCSLDSICYFTPLLKRRKKCNTRQERFFTGAVAKWFVHKV